MNKGRNYYLDMVRGLMVLSMILYHLFYDLVYFFNYDINFFRGFGISLWQRGTVVIFLLVSGVSLRFYSDYKKRGLQIFILGIIITIITYIFNPEEYVLFGILSLIGASIILVGLLEKYLVKINSKLGAVLFTILFFIFFNLPRGYLGFGNYRIFLPRILYISKYTFPIGLPDSTFTSLDYFPLIPWFLIFLAGFYLGFILLKGGYLKAAGRPNILSYIGEKSLIIYLAHQVVIYGVIYIVSRFV
ncbi:DUF1624 domain-containing protein [Anaerosphaera multitolerans]|uniref:DUF1624 domain-containing protein n=1 Tax=Anaerosphaera multitolerans TaxID=2487351 RepID=A0A437S953_9FIRM|nr:heparan-alpha-glucosaminide N-acetyltransferase domain-containing protein [Anaerosphaera multitolerans]RVU55645.1 DUF1624 domain-containing protein [Anaerosphaera multitolerans]